MASHSDTCDRWVRNVQGAGDRELQGSRIIASGDRIYSYGSHFEMARGLRDKTGALRAWLVNGDTFSVSTSKHQGHLRSSIQRYGGVVPSVIVPYSALDAAGIDRDSLEIIEATADAQIPVQRESRTEPRYAHRNSDGELVIGWYPEELVSEPTEADPIYRWTAYVHRLGESLIRAKVHGRRNRAYFLSGFDMQETRPLYFFCELPRGAKPATVTDAYEALKPDTVKVAEQMGRPVVRQGDIFAIQLAGTDKRTLRRQGARFERRSESRSDHDGIARLLGTNHEATEVARMPDGTTLARGTLWHTPPSWRRPDHKRQTMNGGKSWHVIVKNTVPLTRTR